MLARNQELVGQAPVATVDDGKLAEQFGSDVAAKRVARQRVIGWSGDPARRQDP